MDLTGKRVVVAGAGIGGLAAALALGRRGCDVRVFEQADQVAEIGAGLQISANGQAVLQALGVPTGAGLASQGTELRDYRGGRLVANLPPPRAGRTLYFHRADLIGLLKSAAQHAGAAIVPGARVRSCETDGVTLSDGTRHLADFVVAADGGRSTLRAGLNRAGQAVFSHQVAWRATIPWDRSDGPGHAVLTMAPGKHVVTYPLRAHELMNIVAVEERSDWTEESWRRNGDRQDFLTRFAEFAGPAKIILERVETVHLWALFLRPVAETWQNGTMALLGDAAHPTLPFMAQGACLALEDAWVLAASLAGADTIAAGLAAYETARKDRARRVVAAASGNARNFHLGGPTRLIAQLGLGVLGPLLARRFDWIYDHDVTAVAGPLQISRSTQTGT